MLALAMSSFMAGMLFIYLFMPALWRAITYAEDCDVHRGSLVVASRNPIRETGPPANMAKLILLRHKIQNVNRKRRNSSTMRSQTTTRSHVSRPVNLVSQSRSKAQWLRFGRPFLGKQNH